MRGKWSQDQNAPTEVSSANTKRRRFLWGLPACVLVLLAALTGVLSGLAAAGKLVVPGLSGRVFSISYSKAIAWAAKQYGIDPYLLAAVARAESNYDPSAVSRAGAVGVMQLMPETAAWITGLAAWKGPSEPDLSNPADSIELGACYLAHLHHVFRGTTRAVLAAYNAGQGAVMRWVEEAGGLEWFGLENIRFPETRRFVERVEHYWQVYRQVYKDGFPAEAEASL